MYVLLIIIYYRSHFGSRLLSLHNHTECSENRLVCVYTNNRLMPRFSSTQLRNALQHKQQKEEKAQLARLTNPSLQAARANQYAKKQEVWLAFQKELNLWKLWREVLVELEVFPELAEFVRYKILELNAKWYAEHQPWKARPLKECFNGSEQEMEEALKYETEHGVLKDIR